MNGKRTPLQQSHLRASRLALAMASSIPIYIIVVEGLIRNMADTEPILSPAYHNTVRNACIIAAVLSVLLARLVKSLLLTRGVERFPSNSENLAERLRGRLVTVFIISYGFAELPALLGLTAFMLTGQSRTFYLLILVSVYLFVVHAPRYTEWQSWFSVRMREIGLIQE